MYQCPNCHRSDSLTVGITGRSRLHQDSADGSLSVDLKVTDAEWDGEGTIMCTACGIEDSPFEFDVPDTRSLLALLKPHEDEDFSAGQDVLDEAVHDTCNAAAASINNSGLEEQIKFLIAWNGPKDTEARVIEAITACIRFKIKAE